MGIKNQNNVKLIASRSKTGEKFSLIEKYEHKTFKEVEQIEDHLRKELGIYVDLMGLLPNEADRISRTIINEMNYKSFDPIKFTAIETVGRDVLGISTMAIVPEHSGLTNNFGVLVNVDALDGLTYSHQMTGGYKQYKIDDEISKYEQQRERLSKNWDNFSTDWQTQEYIPGEYMKRYENYLTHMDLTEKSLINLQKMKEQGIHRWGAADYGDTFDEYLDLVLLHEFGHLRHIQLWPETITPETAQKSDGMNDFLEGCHLISMYSIWNKQPGENFAEYYSIYRRLPHVLQKKNPLAYKKFKALFG